MAGLWNTLRFPCFHSIAAQDVSPFRDERRTGCAAPNCYDFINNWIGEKVNEKWRKIPEFPVRSARECEGAVGRASVGGAEEVVQEVVGDGLGEEEDGAEEGRAVGAADEVGGLGIDAQGALALEGAGDDAHVAFFG